MPSFPPLPPSILAALGLTAAQAETTETADTAQSEETADTGEAETADTGMYKACLCGCDSLDGRVGAGLLVPALAVLVLRRRSREEILSTLPRDVAARLRQRE